MVDLMTSIHKVANLATTSMGAIGSKIAAAIDGIARTAYPDKSAMSPWWRQTLRDRWETTWSGLGWGEKRENL